MMGAQSATEKRTPLCKAGFEVEGRGAHGDEVCPVRGYNYPTSHSQSVTHITTDGRTVLPCVGALAREGPMPVTIGRRELLAALGSAAVAWPLAARAQQGERVRRIGVLSPLAADDPEERARDAAFAQGLQQLGWIVGQNVRIEYRWGRGCADAMRKYAAELVALAPDVILAGGSSAVGPLLHATRTVPIVFTLVVDPVGASFVDSLARPGGNATGFLGSEYGMGA